LVTPIIPFQIPQEFIAAWQTGALEQVGALLKNVDTGKIVGHLQETGALQHASASLAAGPVGLVASTASQAVGLMQNRQMGKQLTAMQDSLGSMQSLQMLTAVSSIVGIGVTVASTAIILSKMKAIEGTLSTIEQTVEKLPSQWRDLNLRKTL
jgi:flagellar hook assembly protein FlgD